jgi:hypothetical protein
MASPRGMSRGRARLVGRRSRVNRGLGRSWTRKRANRSAQSPGAPGILDAAIVFVVREVMIGLYRHELHAPEIASLGFLLLVVGAVRIAAVRFSPARSIVHAP